MLTKLKNLFLSSVDLVRRGANQEADICLYKSAETEDPVPDTEIALAYTGALAKSILSIQEDETLDDVAKVDMIQKSFEQFGKAVEATFPSDPEQDPEQDPEEDPEEVLGKDDPADKSMFDVIEEIETKKA